MNILHPLPRELNVNSRTLRIKTDFRVWLQFQKCLRDGAQELELVRALKSVFLQDVVLLPMDGVAAFTACVEFMQSAKGYANDVKTPNKAQDVLNVPYDYEIDSSYIYAAFLGEYGLDLCDVEELHYHKFIALLESLSPETMFKKIVGYRTADVRGIKDKAQRAQADKLRKMFEIVDVKAQEDFEASKAQILAEWS